MFALVSQSIKRVRIKKICVKTIALVFAIVYRSIMAMSAYSNYQHNYDIEDSN